MPRQSLDLSFNRHGRPLAAWLWDLVDDEAATRIAAGKALQAMQMGLPSVKTLGIDIDWESSRELEGQGDRFLEAVRAAIRMRGFRSSEFVGRLIARRIVQADDWRRRVEKAFPAEDRPTAMEKRLIERMNAAADEAERAEATRRWMRWVCARMARDSERTRDAYAGAESMTAAAFMAMNVFDALDVVLLADRDGLWRMLRHRLLHRYATQALVRIGPPAVEFARFFLDKLDAQDKDFDYTGAAALGSIGRNDSAVIDAL